MEKNDDNDKKEALLKIEKSEAWNEETTCVKILSRKVVKHAKNL